MGRGEGRAVFQRREKGMGYIAAPDAETQERARPANLRHKDRQGAYPRCGRRMDAASKENAPSEAVGP